MNARLPGCVGRFTTRLHNDTRCPALHAFRVHAYIGSLVCVDADIETSYARVKACWASSTVMKAGGACETILIVQYRKR